MPRMLLNPFMYSIGGMVELTINPIPNGATVTFDTGTVVGNTCKVKSGTIVGYTVSYSGLETQTGEIYVYQNTELSVDLHYANGTVLFESSTAGSSTLDILVATAYCNLICVGGGGGGRTYVYSFGSSTKYCHAAGGGSGGYSTDYAQVSNGVSISVGSAAGRSSGTGTASSGGSSSVGSILSAGGGVGGYIKNAASSSGSHGGAGGSGTTTNGNSGSYQFNSSGTYANGAGGASVYSSYGRGCSVRQGPSGSGSTTTASTAGYVKITAATPPTYSFTIVASNDFIVQMTTAGHTQSGNSIDVNAGNTVAYSVSKPGFVPFGDVIEITADTVLTFDNIKLKRLRGEIDCGNIYSATVFYDAGQITGTVTRTRNAGSITGAVTNTDDAGAIVNYTPDETIDCGAIDSTVTDMIECGPIM